VIFIATPQRDLPAICLFMIQSLTLSDRSNKGEKIKGKINNSYSNLYLID
jgi:hypothetical protein